MCFLTKGDDIKYIANTIEVAFYDPSTSKSVNYTTKLQNANDAKEWVKTNWNLRDDIQNLPLEKDIKLSTRTGKNYFNITIEQDKQVKSYNFA